MAEAGRRKRGRVVVAPDSFRGSVTAAEFVETVSAVADELGLTPVGLPLADGGEGTLDVFGGPNREDMVTGPLGETVTAGWRRERHRAVIEVARVSGLDLVGGAAANDALAASTFGVGELIIRAVDAGVTEVVVTLGGSATTDAGLGAIRAMEPVVRMRRIDIVVACDVETRFTHAAAEFGPQKGATPAQVKLLTRRLEHLAEHYLAAHRVDVDAVPGSGAAGGLAGGLAAIGAELRGGFEMVSEELGLDEALAEADLVITGEGRLDVHSWDGKVVGGVKVAADRHGVPVVALVGSVAPGTDVSGLSVVSLTEEHGADAAMGDTRRCLADSVARVFATQFSLPAS